MGSKSSKMYKDSPKLERDEDGNLGVTQRQEESDETQAGTEGMAVGVRQAHDRRDMHHRHEMEHMALHHKHEREHMAHDIAKGGEKHEMHKRHEEEHKAMTDRHHHEMKKMHAKHEKNESLEPTHKESGEPKGEAKGGKGTEEKTHSEKDGKEGESAEKKAEVTNAGEKK